MFCRNCGKDIGDSKFCPECGTKQDDINEVKAEPVTETPKQDAKNGEAPVYKNPYEPDKDTPNFGETLKKDCKGYKALDIIDTVRTILVFVVPVSFVIFSWIQNSGSNFGYILLNGLLNALPTEFFLFVIDVPLAVGMQIIFTVKMNKDKVSNKELFKSVCTDGEYNYGVPGMPEFSPWEAISFKYQKTSFVISIVQRVLYIIEWSCIFFTAYLFLVTSIPAAQSYGLFTTGFSDAWLSSFKGGLTVILIYVVLDLALMIANKILNSVKTKSHRKLVEKLRAGELDK
ncbi:MAG: zinc ribbon domain-containing protein [Clostridia bacterium]|nr:zinc ribbon domain-containing protein [Clostridia bacterium]